MNPSRDTDFSDTTKKASSKAFIANDISFPNIAGLNIRYSDDINHRLGVNGNNYISTTAQNSLVSSTSNENMNNQRSSSTTHALNLLLLDNHQTQLPFTTRHPTSSRVTHFLAITMLNLLLNLSPLFICSNIGLFPNWIHNLLRTYLESY